MPALVLCCSLCRESQSRIEVKLAPTKKVETGSELSSKFCSETVQLGNSYLQTHEIYVLQGFGTLIRVPKRGFHKIPYRQSCSTQNSVPKLCNLEIRIIKHEKVFRRTSFPRVITQGFWNPNKVFRRTNFQFLIHSGLHTHNLRILTSFKNFNTHKRSYTRTI